MGIDLALQVCSRRYYNSATDGVTCEVCPSGFACDEPAVHSPRSELVAVYIDQFPHGEIGRQVCLEHGIPIFNSIQAALTQGDKSLGT